MWKVFWAWWYYYGFWCPYFGMTEVVQIPTKAFCEAIIVCNQMGFSYEWYRFQPRAADLLVKPLLSEIRWDSVVRNVLIAANKQIHSESAKLSLQC